MKKNVNNKLVSIIIPTYKTNDSLERAVNSVLEQSYNNIEVIVVDDNNPETEFRTYAESILKKYKNNEKVRYIKHEVNKNGSAARNTGIKAALGEYIGFLDDDDYFLPNKLKKQVEFLENNDYQVCTCFYKRDEVIFSFDDKEDYTVDILLNNKVPQTSSFLMKKECVLSINGFDETYSRHQDFEFMIRLFRKYKIKLLPEVLYVMDNNGVNNVPNGKKMEELKDKFLMDFDKDIKKHNLNKMKVYGRNYSLVCFAYFKNKDLKNFFRVLKKHFSIYLILGFCKRCVYTIIYKLKRI